MKIYEWKMKFLTPAFLGNSEQKGQWRTPPIKSLLRQWWRVAYAKKQDFKPDLQRMREEEGRLFGNAWLAGDFQKSKVLIRLDGWTEGKLTSWQPLPSIPHPEVRRHIGSDLYLGYGPLEFKKGVGPQLKKNAAIQEGESSNLSIAIRDNDNAIALLESAFWLMDRYGSVGGRSRNGWGSFHIEPQSDTARAAVQKCVTPFRPWHDCLGMDWPHSIGEDQRGALIWQTKPEADWKKVMEKLARIKIGLRTQFIFPNAQPLHPSPEQRHWLSYPVTNHDVIPWKGLGLRLPNSLRFKVRRRQDGNLYGVIFHVPCLPPPVFTPNPKVIKDIWSSVHGFLDGDNQLTRCPE